ncbi:MAG: hypothetical protein ABI361_10460 [Nitrososphaera sp.]|jgi:hypothetical protein
MYAKVCNVEILPSYIQEVSVGDLLTIQALITNPLDWQHFYEKLSVIEKGERTDFTVITPEGDRIIGFGNVTEFERWSDRGKYGFKIKIDITKQKSLTDRRIRGPHKLKAEVRDEKMPQKPKVIPEIVSPAQKSIKPRVFDKDMSAKDMTAFKELLEGSLGLDISSSAPAST